MKSVFEVCFEVRFEVCLEVSFEVRFEVCIEVRFEVCFVVRLDVSFQVSFNVRFDVCFEILLFFTLNCSTKMFVVTLQNCTPVGLLLRPYANCFSDISQIDFSK